MKYYEVRLSKVIGVEAQDEQEAEQKAREIVNDPTVFADYIDEITKEDYDKLPKV